MKDKLKISEHQIIQIFTHLFNIFLKFNFSLKQNKKIIIISFTLNSKSPFSP